MLLAFALWAAVAPRKLWAGRTFWTGRTFWAGRTFWTGRTFWAEAAPRPAAFRLVGM